MPRNQTSILLMFLGVAALAASVRADASLGEPRVIRPFEAAVEFISVNPIDEHVLAVLRRRGIEPAYLCSDEVFIRRVYLDVIGTLPDPRELRDFLGDRRPDKRAVLIEALLQREEFADYWAMKWCDLLRVKSEFPINLWPNAVQAYHQWIRDAIARNKPYDCFARELLTASGSNFRVPPVNFYRAVQGCEAPVLGAAAALTFMGTRLDRWPEDQRRGLEAFFSRVAYKETAEWKEEIVCLSPKANKPLDAVFPDGTKIRILPGEDPRRVFADWLIRPDNEWFARNIVNRLWAWLMGRGIIEEPDDIRSDNPPSNPGLLAYLESELVESSYDLRHIYRLILNSRTYQQSCTPRSRHEGAERLFAYYVPRRLDAEVLIDALNTICGSGEKYTSPIPEPFTFIPEGQRTIALADGSISSPFLELFGRPPRDTGLMSERDNKPTDAQRLYLLNSSHIQKKIEDSQRLRALVRETRKDRRVLVRSLYVMILSRQPTPAELAAAEQYLRIDGGRLQQAVHDLTWALINTKEFLYRH